MKALLPIVVLGACTGGSAIASVPVEVVASSSRGPENAAFMIFDGDRHTMWCEGLEGFGTEATLTLTFSRPVPVQRIQVNLGRGDRTALIRRMEIAIDGKANEYSAYDINATPVARLGDADVMVREARFRLSEASPDWPGDGCIADIFFRTAEGDRHYLVAGLDAKALAAYRPALFALAKALESCDESVLALAIGFPMLARKRDGFGGLDKREWRDVGSFVGACRKSGTPRLRIDPGRAADTTWSMAPGRGRVPDRALRPLRALGARVERRALAARVRHVVTPAKRQSTVSSTVADCMSMIWRLPRSASRSGSPATRRAFSARKK